MRSPLPREQIQRNALPSQKKLQTNIPNEYRYRYPQQNISKPNLTIYEKNIHINTHTHTHIAHIYM